ncbi:chemotaxis protein CheA [Natronospora cellulosivora (SeqCode)]
MSHNNEIDEEFLQDFIIETRENLETIEMNLLDLEKEPDNEQILHSLFRAFHTIKGLAGFVDQDLIQELSHKTETILDLCRKGSLVINKQIINIILKSSDIIGEICTDISLISDENYITKVQLFIEQLESCEGILNKMAELEKANRDLNERASLEQPKKIGEILLEDNIIDKESIDYILNKQKQNPNLKFGQIAINEKIATSKDIIKGIHKQQTLKSCNSNGGIIRIPTKKVDNLVDMMGELIITQSQLEQEAYRKFGSNDSYITKLMNMSRIMKEVQSLSMSLRMVSLRSTFQKISRIARDTIDELDKNINFIVEGEETEIDRNIAEKLLEPLVHLVKNSISHGIENQQLRQERNKRENGQVKVSAYSNKGSVYIEVSDDGNGIDIEKVYQKAVEKKLIDTSKKYGDREILDFILLPGFSTTENVDTISGRGVGMDVVKTQISKIGGKIEVINNPGKGCKFVLKIPINLAVMNGTIINIAGSKYIIPTLNIKQIVQLSEDKWVEVKGKRAMVKVREAVIPVINISRVLEDDHNYQKSLVIILEMDNRIRALPVDDIVDRREIVVKPMGEEFADLNFVSGASILGDGTVSLIIDIETIIKI